MLSSTLFSKPLGINQLLDNFEVRYVGLLSKFYSMHFFFFHFPFSILQTAVHLMKKCDWCTKSVFVKTALNSAMAMSPFIAFIFIQRLTSKKKYGSKRIAYSLLEKPNNNPSTKTRQNRVLPSLYKFRRV